jgi:hypothetical protein
MTAKEKIGILYSESKEVLRIVRDLRAAAKSTQKTKLMKIERHSALMVGLFADLLDAFEKDKK